MTIGLDGRNQSYAELASRETETGLLTTFIAFPLAICPGWRVVLSRRIAMGVAEVAGAEVA